MRIQSKAAANVWKLVLVGCAAYGLLGSYGLNFPYLFTNVLATCPAVALIAVGLLQRAKQTAPCVCGCD